jgi:hypothetical protein
MYLKALMVVSLGLCLACGSRSDTGGGGTWDSLAYSDCMDGASADQEDCLDGCTDDQQACNENCDGTECIDGCRGDAEDCLADCSDDAADDRDSCEDRYGY